MMSEHESDREYRWRLIGAGVLLLCVAVLVLVSSGSLVLVEGGSMEPDMSDGSVAVCEDVNGWDVEEGDVIVFTLADRYIVHEVIDVETETNMVGEPRERNIRAQGWANDEKDPWIPAHLVECEVHAWVDVDDRAVRW